MSDDDFVNLGHLIAMLEPSEFDKIPRRLFVDNLDEFRDNVEEQMKQKGFGDRIKNITKKVVEALGYVENTECYISIPVSFAKYVTLEGEGGSSRMCQASFFACAHIVFVLCL